MSFSSPLVASIVVSVAFGVTLNIGIDAAPLGQFTLRLHDARYIADIPDRWHRAYLLASTKRYIFGAGIYAASRRFFEAIGRRHYISNI